MVAKPASRRARPKAKAKAKKQSPHLRQLDKLEAQLARTTDAEELGALARAFHSVGYSLGHDISAIIDNPGIVDRAKRGEVGAYERASAACASNGNVALALHYLFTSLDTYPGPPERVRLAELIATQLDTHDPAHARQLREALAAVSGDDDDEARRQFYAVIARVKGLIAWHSLPRDS